MFYYIVYKENVRIIILVQLIIRSDTDVERNC